MTVLQYVFSNDIQEFYCETTTELILVHTHKSNKGKESKVSELFFRKNLCWLNNWNKYMSFNTFANKEIVKIGKDFRNIPIFYVDFKDGDWQEEIKNIFTENKRDYNYYIDLERTRTI